MEIGSRDFMFDLRKLRVLRSVDDHGTVSAAADRLHLTPSAVSQQIAGLSRELGIPLLERRGRRVALTGPARVMLKHAAAVEEQLELARADLASWSVGEVGEVRIGSLATGISALVAPAVEVLCRERPALQLRAIECEPEAAFAGLRGGELDLVIQAESSRVPPQSDPAYHRTLLVTDVMDLVIPAGDVRADPRGVRLDAFAKDVWIGGEASDTCWMISVGICAAAGFAPDVRHYCSDWDAVGALVATGAGVALVPRLAFPLRASGIAVCPVVGEPASRSLYATVRAGAEQDPTVAAVLATLVGVSERSA